MEVQVLSSSSKGDPLFFHTLSALARHDVDNRLKDISDMLQGRSSRI